MALTKAERAEVNRRNSKHSTGPKTPEGKAVSRRNAVKHGLTSTVIDPVDAPGEPHGAYQERLELWLDDVKPRNMLEAAMVKQACRASWKLDRVARFEDAAAFRRAERGPSDRDRDRDRESDPGAEVLTPAEYVRQLGWALLIDLESEPNPDPEPYPYALPPVDPSAPLSPFCNPGYTVGLLCQVTEGLEWLLSQWAELLPRLRPEVEDWSPFDPDVRRARVLLGLRDFEPQPPVAPRAAGLGEVRRLQGLHAALSAATPAGPARIDCDLALFDASPEAQLLIRYEAAAERELHRSVNTLIKLRQNPELFDAGDAAGVPPGDAGRAGPPEGAGTQEVTGKAGGTRGEGAAGPTGLADAGRPCAPGSAGADPRRGASPSRNEPRNGERLNPRPGPDPSRPGARAGGKRGR